MTGLYYEEFVLNACYETGTQTISAHMIDVFSTLTGDTNPIHENNPTKPHPLGQQIVHGMLVAAVGTGLISGLELTRGTLIALLEQHLRYRHPVFAGDTVHARMKVIDKRPTRKPDRGIVEYQFEIRNQQDTVCIEGHNRIMVFTRHPTSQTPDGDIQ